MESQLTDSPTIGTIQCIFGDAVQAKINILIGRHSAAAHTTYSRASCFLREKCLLSFEYTHRVQLYLERIQKLPTCRVYLDTC